MLAGAPAAYACCRPPGHHVTRGAYGGCCYLNNGAIAAARLRDALGGPVALLDLDAHHGNGAQAIFYERGDVRDRLGPRRPGRGLVPALPRLRAARTGPAPGAGRTATCRSRPAAGDDGWLAAVRELAAWARGFGRARSWSRSASTPRPATRRARCAVTRDGYRAAGRALGALGLPTVVVQEGGYDVRAIGALVRAALEGIDDGLAAAAEARSAEVARG